jgi:hypothetical protein
MAAWAASALAQGAPVGPSSPAPAVTPAAKGEPAAPLTDRQRLARSDEALERIRRQVKLVVRRIDDARGEKDIVRLTCLDEKAVQMKGLLRVAERAGAALQEAVAKKEEGSDAELTKVTLARARVDELRSDAEACVGQLAYSVDEKTKVEVERTSEPTERAPPPPAPSRPPAASRVE